MTEVKQLTILHILGEQSEGVVGRLQENRVGSSHHRRDLPQSTRVQSAQFLGKPTFPPDPCTHHIHALSNTSDPHLLALPNQRIQPSRHPEHIDILVRLLQPDTPRRLGLIPDIPFVVTNLHLPLENPTVDAHLIGESELMDGGVG